MPTNETTDGKPFASWLVEQAGGKTESELTDGLRDLVTRVADTGKRGSLQLTVVVEPMKEDASMLLIKDEIKLKLPEHDRKASIFWQKDGELLRNDPNQLSVFDEIARQNVNVETGEVLD